MWSRLMRFYYIIKNVFLNVKIGLIFFLDGMFNISMFIYYRGKRDNILGVLIYECQNRFGLHGFRDCRINFWVQGLVKYSYLLI